MSNPAFLDYLADVAEDLDAARKLRGNRFAAFHVQQAAEKLVKALRIAHGLRPTVDHHIDALLAEIPESELRTRMSGLDDWSDSATTFRYPGPGGRRRPGPADSDIDAAIAEIESLVPLVRDLAPRG